MSPALLTLNCTLAVKRRLEFLNVWVGIVGGAVWVKMVRHIQVFDTFFNGLCHTQRGAFSWYPLPVRPFSLRSAWSPIVNEEVLFINDQLGSILTEHVLNVSHDQNQSFIKPEHQ